MKSIMYSQNNEEEMKSIHLATTDLGVSVYPKGDPGNTYIPEVTNGKIIVKNNGTNETKDLISSFDSEVTIYQEGPFYNEDGSIDETRSKIVEGVESSITLDDDTKQLQFSLDIPAYATAVKLNDNEDFSTELSIYAPTEAPATLLENPIITYVPSSTTESGITIPATTKWTNPESLNIITSAAEQTIAGAKTFTAVPKLGSSVSIAAIDGDNNNLITKAWHNIYTPKHMAGTQSPIDYCTAQGIIPKDGDIYFQV